VQDSGINSKKEDTKTIESLEKKTNPLPIKKEDPVFHLPLWI
jgi:hypothetical protein